MAAYTDLTDEALWLDSGYDPCPPIALTAVEVDLTRTMLRDTSYSPTPSPSAPAPERPPQPFLFGYR